MKNKFLIIFFIFTFLFQNQTISYSIEPKNFISEVVDEAKKILVASNSKEIKEKKLSEMAKKVADISGIGMYSLGSYKKILNESQLEEYKVLFQQYFLKSFTSRLTGYLLKNLMKNILWLGVYYLQLIKDQKSKLTGGFTLQILINLLSEISLWKV